MSCAPESLRAEASRRGVSLYQVRKDRGEFDRGREPKVRNIIRRTVYECARCGRKVMEETK